jgi:hypothetical protein
MKFLRRAFATLAAIAFAGGAAVAADDRVAAANDRVAAANDRVAAMVDAPTQPSMYSFADVFRLTVAGAATPDNALPKSAALADYQLRVVSSEPQPAVRQVFPTAAAAPLHSSMFAIGAMPPPERWLLILSGLAAAGWVARRRLGSSF